MQHFYLQECAHKSTEKLEQDAQRETGHFRGGQKAARGMRDGNLTRSILDTMIHSGIIFAIKIHNKSRQSVKLLTSTK